MSTVQDTTNASSLYGRSTSTVVKGSAEDTQNRFLALLVAQMKNQDPLNPLDNAEVTSQMAQLSTVQGIENMNSSLQAMAASLGTNQMSQAASLIGRTVLVPGNTISPAQLDNVMGFELSRPADKVTAGVYDASGAGAQADAGFARRGRERGGVGRPDGRRDGRAGGQVQLQDRRRPGGAGRRQHHPEPGHGQQRFAERPGRAIEPGWQYERGLCRCSADFLSSSSRRAG